MMQSISATIQDVDEANDLMYIFVGNFGFPVSISEFKRRMDGIGVEGLSRDAIVHNVAIRASLGNADMNDMNSIQKVVEGATYKI